VGHVPRQHLVQHANRAFLFVLLPNTCCQDLLSSVCFPTSFCLCRLQLFGRDAAAERGGPACARHFRGRPLLEDAAQADGPHQPGAEQADRAHPPVSRHVPEESKHVLLRQEVRGLTCFWLCWSMKMRALTRFQSSIQKSSLMDQVQNRQDRLILLSAELPCRKANTS
jgi:hypothetical protein